MSRPLAALASCARFAVALRVPRRGSFSFPFGGAASRRPKGGK